MYVIYSDVFVEAMGEVEVVVEVDEVVAKIDEVVVEVDAVLANTDEIVDERNEVEAASSSNMYPRGAVEIVLPPPLAALCRGFSLILYDLETIEAVIK